RCRARKVELFDHLVGAGEHRGRQIEAERLGGPQVDEKLISGRLLYRKLGRIGTTQDAIDIDRRSPPEIDRVGPGSAPRDHHSSAAENRRTKSGFSFANGECVTHMRQGFPLQRLFAVPLRSICPAAVTASSRAASRSGSSTPIWSMCVRSSSI